MAEMPTLTVRIKCDEDYLRLTAYRMALRMIADAPEHPWERDENDAEPREVALAVLRAMGEDAKP